MIIPSGCKRGECSVDPGKENEVQAPHVHLIVDVQDSFFLQKLECLNKYKYNNNYSTDNTIG